MIIIVSNKEWHRKYIEDIEVETGLQVIYVSKKEDITYEYMKKLNPLYVFFPHWSYIIPPEVYENFECVVFHMTDLPFGRGGSPLQNLIANSIYESKLSALRCQKSLDAGDIYLKEHLSLYGTAEEIYLRAAKLTKKMIIEIVKKKIKPVPQSGEPVVFKRRKPEESDISGMADLQKIFDYIRMLDADGYPRAFIDIGKLHFEFERASLKDGFIKADVKIIIKG